MKEPWFNISWPKFLGFVAQVGTILGFVETAPIPEKWRIWARFASFFLCSVAGFLLNPKPKRWISDEQAEVEEEAAIMVAPVPTPVAWPKEPPAPPASPSLGLTAEQMQLIAQLIKGGQVK